MANFPKFKTGNVIKDGYNHIHIITNVTGNGTKESDYYYSWIPIDSTNCSGGTYETTQFHSEQCDCVYRGIPDEECETCKGVGQINVERKGLDQAVLIGSNVKEYILSSLLKNFNF